MLQFLWVRTPGITLGISQATLRWWWSLQSCQDLTEKTSLPNTLKWLLKESVFFGVVGLKSSVPHWLLDLAIGRSTIWQLVSFRGGKPERKRGEDAQDGEHSLFIT